MRYWFAPDDLFELLLCAPLRKHLLRPVSMSSRLIVLRFAMSEHTRRRIALYFMYYNFGRIHQTLRVTPAMEAGVANHVWSIQEIVELMG